MISEVTLAVFWFACGAAAATAVAFVVVVRMGYIIKALRQSCSAYRTEIKATTERDTAFLTDNEAVEALYNHNREQRDKIYTMWVFNEELKNEVEKRDTFCIANVLDLFVKKYEEMKYANLKQDNEITQLRNHSELQKSEATGLNRTITELRSRIMTLERKLTEALKL